MALAVSAILANRRHAIVNAWAADPLLQVQVESAAALARLAHLYNSEPGATEPQALGRRSEKNVVFVGSRVQPDVNASVWVAAGYSDYVGAFLAFLSRTYEVEAKRSDLAGFDVDHLLNRARSPLDSTFIRVEATPSVANQAWGRLFEKASSNPQFYANAHRERRTMSYMICAKLAGEMPPANPRDAAGITRLANFFASIGLDRAEAQRGLLSMLEFAYRFR